MFLPSQQTSQGCFTFPVSIFSDRKEVTFFREVQDTVVSQWRMPNEPKVPSKRRTASESGSILTVPSCCSTTSNWTVPVNKQPDEDVRGTDLQWGLPLIVLDNCIGFINSANIYFIASGLNSLLPYGFLLLHSYCLTLFTRLLCIVCSQLFQVEKDLLIMQGKAMTWEVAQNVLIY